MRSRHSHRAGQAGWLGVVEEDHVPAADDLPKFRRIRRQACFLDLAILGAERAPSPVAPWRLLWIRFVISKKPGPAVIANHRASTPAPRAYPSSDWSISATPPPRAVELMCQIARPANTSRPEPIACATSLHESSPSTGRNRSGASGGIGTC